MNDGNTINGKISVSVGITEEESGVRVGRTADE